MNHIDFYYDNGKSYSARRVKYFHYGHADDGCPILNYTQLDTEKATKNLTVRTVSTVRLEDVHTLVFHTENEFGLRDIVVRRLKPCSIVNLNIRQKNREKYGMSNLGECHRMTGDGSLINNIRQGGRDFEDDKYSASRVYFADVFNTF